MSRISFELYRWEKVGIWMKQDWPWLKMHKYMGVHYTIPLLHTLKISIKCIVYLYNTIYTSAIKDSCYCPCNILFQNCLLETTSGRRLHCDKEIIFQKRLKCHIQKKQKQQKGKIFRRITIRQHISLLMQNAILR